MLGLVRIALRRPYTFVVLAIVIFIVGPLSAIKTPTDIFPDIRIPVISVVWQYTGLPPDQMSGRITSPFERTITTTVNDVEHIEAESVAGFGIIKIFFQPGVNIATANAQVTAVAQTQLRQLPPGTTPPLILNYNASTVPIIQLALSGKGLSEQNLGRPRPEPVAAATRDGRGRGHSLPVRRQDAAGSDRCRSVEARGSRPLRTGRRKCTRNAKSDHARRHREDGRSRVHPATERRTCRNPRAGRPAH